MTFSLFHHVSVGCHTRAYPIVIRTIWRWLVCANNFHREDEPHYDISGRCHPGVYFLFFEITQSLEMCTWFLPRMSFIVAFLL